MGRVAIDGEHVDAPNWQGSVSREAKSLLDVVAREQVGDIVVGAGDALRRSSLIDRQGNKAPLLENKGRITCDGGSRGERPRPPYTSMRAASSLSLEHALVV